MDRSLLRKLAVHYIAPRYPLKPTTLFVNPTLRCSARCAHCLLWAEKGRNKTELTPARWRDIMAHPFFSAIRSFWLGGGEPTLREDLSEIALAAAETLPSLESITIATNALDPQAIERTLERILPELERRDIYAHLHISLDGPTEIHDRIRGVEGAFSAIEKTVAIARRLRDEGKALGWNFNCVIQKGNIDCLEQTVDAARKLEGTITFNMADVTRGFYRRTEGEALEDSERQKVLRFIESLLTDSDSYHSRHYETVSAVLKGRPRPYRCETLEATFYMDPDASIILCPRAYETLSITLNDVSPPEAWKKAFAQKEWIRRELCPTCALGCSFGEGVTVGEFFKLKIED